MADDQFVVSDLDFENLDDLQASKSDNSFRDSISIKEEIVKDDDILLFTQAEMDELSNASANTFEIVDNIGNTVQIPDNSSFNIPFSDEQLNQLLNSNGFTPKLNYDMFASKISNIKTEGNFSHFIKYKVQDGKHTKVWQCGICSKEFGHQYILMRHLPTHTDERKFQCNICGKAFRQMSTLSQHRAIHSAERPYVCEICQKTFNRVSTLISHRKTHTGHKPHRCHLCNKAFHQKGNLRNHIFTHTNERPYKCDICSKGFNQMSNLMCHKLKAHQRADKPRYTCQTCGKEFQKRMGLRNHEQYEHGDMTNQGSGGGSLAPRIRYSNGVLVDPINTAAMQHALATNQTPFALLRPLNGIPVLVRVLAAGDKQMLVPATAEDLKKHGQITITEKPSDEEAQVTEIKAETDPNADGSTVQIKIPVVATVVQRCGKDGNMCMDVESPGPSSGGLMHDSYLVNATTENTPEGQQVVAKPPDMASLQMPTSISNQNPMVSHSQILENDAPIEYFDLTGNVIGGEPDKNRVGMSQSFSFDSTVDMFNSNLQFAGDVIELDGSQGSMDGNNVNIYPDGIFDIQPGDNGTHVFEILEKPSGLAIADNVLSAGNMLYDPTNLNQQFL